uniref:Serine protease family S09X putative n=1 Tax=Albugo laibachii Nc14 TaxID=890382 RepID=F0WCS1_9STRA|nr:serine protease family S09X putative [Albugo laibachii Nc14]|eukprot:CCA18990.1 serine protease family S09X putative [Albugo laibachii Nc14]
MTLRLEKCKIPVSDPPRNLLGMVAMSEEVDAADITDVIVFLHGFPDLAVHPTKLEFGSRLVRKLATYFCVKNTNPVQLALATFNSSGIFGSDQEIKFYNKRLSLEVEDALAGCAFVRKKFQHPVRIHVVGHSTGAILASLLRSKSDLVDSVTVIAGLLDLPNAYIYDFDATQCEQFQVNGFCWKEFYLPKDYILDVKRYQVSLDGKQPISSQVDTALIGPKVYFKLSREYKEEYVKSRESSSNLNIESSVRCETSTPILIIHGDDDNAVPHKNGVELFEAAAEPKTFVSIPNANHMLRNDKHLKKALRAIMKHIQSL